MQAEKYMNYDTSLYSEINKLVLNILKAIDQTQACRTQGVICKITLIELRDLQIVEDQHLSSRLFREKVYIQ